MKLLVVSPWWDLSETDGSSTQITNLITLFQSIFPETYFLAPNKKNLIMMNKKVHFKKTFLYPFSHIGQFSMGYFLDYNIFYQNIITYIIIKYQIDVIFISFPWGLQYVKRKFPQIPVIYGANGYEREFAKISWGKLPFPFRSILSHLIGLQEKNAINKSELIIAVSELLTRELSQNFPKIKSKIKTIKMGFNLNFSTKMNDTDRTQTLSHYSLDPSKKYFTFHGALKHWPNFEAIQLIKKKIAPQIWQIDQNIHFCAFGQGNKRVDYKNIHFFPFIEDLDPFMQSMTGAIMPILSGSGIRIKVMDYFRNHLPIISTRKGIEGYGLTSKELIITPNQIDSQFINGIIKVVQNPEIAKKMEERCWYKINNELNNSILVGLLKQFLYEFKMLK